MDYVRPKLSNLKRLILEENVLVEDQSIITDAGLSIISQRQRINYGLICFHFKPVLK